MTPNHHHEFDPVHLDRLDDPLRRVALPPALVAEALTLTPGERVADLGCGVGYGLFALLDAAPDDVRFWAVDTEPLMLQTLKARLVARRS
jgi:ubiquinone/menaquinone biosynthesis C-methylase UbiE